MTSPHDSLDSVRARIARAVASSDQRSDTEQRQLLADLLAEALLRSVSPKGA